FGPGFYHLIDGWTYCTDCLVTCPYCQQLTAMTSTCASCGDPCCSGCGVCCDVCNEQFCSAHASLAKTCEHRLCTEHTLHCHLCQGLVCPVCDPICGICARAFCPIDGDSCQQCGQSYCRECIRRSGLCDTCATHHRDSERVNMAEEPCAQDPQVAKLVRHFYWTRATNERYTIYVGDGGLTTRMVVVVDRLPSPHKVVAVRKSPPLEALLGRLWR
ncbi:MAG TPA: hypothetical protein PKE45_11705, partial [Caldilineaceae bacterium]|nr:hypothetical protein [Caldilineaceae bacterium]